MPNPSSASVTLSKARATNVYNPKAMSIPMKKMRERRDRTRTNKIQMTVRRMWFLEEPSRFFVFCYRAGLKDSPGEAHFTIRHTGAESLRTRYRRCDELSLT